jgi:hypothetical protein
MRPKIMIAVAATVAVVGGAFAWKAYDRAPSTGASMPAKETVTAPALLAAFNANEQAATEKYVGTIEQVVQVSGSIRAIEPAADGKTNVTLETGDALAGVVCEFNKGEAPSTWKAGDAVAVKGICTGLLLDVILVRCAPVE